MNLGPLEIRRRRAQAAAATNLPPPHDTQLGASGTINLDGYLRDEEYNPDLFGKEGYKVFQRMLASDGSVREAYRHCVTPIMNATWDIEAAGDEPEQLEQAAFARCALFDWMIEPFPSLLQTTLEYMVVGFQLFEMVEQIVEKELKWIDPTTGDQVTSPARQFVCWRRWAQRMPETIWRWPSHDGELLSVQQTVFKDGDYVYPIIPAANLALFTNEQSGDDWTGQSIFRSAYFAWSLKQLVEKIAAISVERHGVGINVGYIPDSQKNDETVMARVEEMLRDLSAGERPYLVFPGPRQQSTSSGSGGGEGYLFEIVTPQGGLPDFVPLLGYLRGEIKGTVVARFSELGHGQTGARATGDVQSQVWYDSVQSVADYTAGVFNSKIAALIDKNYPGVEYHPKVVARDIQARTLSEYADSLSKLALAQLIVPDRAARAAARKAADIPDEDEADPALQQADQKTPPVDPKQNGKPPVDAVPAPAGQIETE